MTLLLAETTRLRLQISRDPFQFWFGKLIFLAFFFGYRLLPTSMAATSGLENQVGAAASYLVLLALLIGVGFAARQLEADILSGAIERILQSPLGLRRVVRTRSIVGGLQTLATVAILAAALKLCAINVEILPETVVAVAGAVIVGSSLGVAVAAIGLLLRPVALLVLPVNILIMVMVAAKTAHPAIGLFDMLLPGAPGIDLIGAARSPAEDRLAAAATAAALLALQIIAIEALARVLFAWAERRAKRRGTLGLR
jgi:hypothetical protein